MTLLLLLLFCVAYSDLISSAQATDNNSPLSQQCQDLRDGITDYQLQYGREIVSSTIDENAIVLLSDLSWGAVQYLQHCEPHVFTTFNISHTIEEKEQKNQSVSSRYLHLARQEPQYVDISWPIKDNNDSNSQLLADFMAANTPKTDIDLDDETETDGNNIDDFPTIFVELNLISTTEFSYDGTWQGLYSYVPWGFLCKLSPKRPQWRFSYELHIDSVQHLLSLKTSFPSFMPVDVNKRAAVAAKHLKKYKKMSKRKKKKETPIYARRFLTSLFKNIDNTAHTVTNDDETKPQVFNGNHSFLKQNPVGSVDFAIAKQFIDAHTELAMHMMTSSLSVSKEVASTNPTFDFYQCARTLDRLLIACDLLTSAIEVLYKFSEEANGVGTYESKRVLFSRGLVPSSTHLFSLLKNLIVSSQNAEDRVGFFLRMPTFNSSVAQQLFPGERDNKDQLILISDFINGSLLSLSTLDETRDLLVNAVEAYTHLARGIPEDEVERYQHLVKRMEKNLETRPEAQRMKAEAEAAAEAATAEVEGGAQTGAGDEAEQHVEL